KHAILALTNFGGVYLIDKDTPILNGFRTLSLSDLLDDPDGFCLANGPGGESQVFLGCRRLLYYMELSMGASGPEATFLAPIPFPVGSNTFYRLVVQNGPRRIVAATGAGVWWSAIPSNPRNVSAYQWQPSTGLPGLKVGGLCARSGDNLHAALWGTGAP